MEADPNYGKIEATSSSDNLSKLSEGAAADASANGQQEAPKKKAKKNKDDPYAPTPSQVQAMLDDMLLLEQIGISEVREAEEIVLDEGNEDEEIPMELLDRAEKIKRRNRDLQKKKDGNLNFYQIFFLISLCELSLTYSTCIFSQERYF